MSFKISLPNSADNLPPVSRTILPKPPVIKNITTTSATPSQSFESLSKPFVTKSPSRYADTLLSGYSLLNSSLH